MGPTENIVLFTVLASVILLVFIGSMIFFIFQYHRRKLIHEKEKATLNEEHLKELFNTKLEIQQYTMQEIGREIHDSINQQLTLASLYTYQLEAENENTHTGQKVSRIGDIINESITNLRNLSKNLVQTDADNTSLNDLVDKECRRINALNTCRATYHFSVSNIPLSPTLKNHLHRIIQEFLQNSVKHARCKNIFLSFDLNSSGLSIVLKDDGKGFDLDNYELETKGIGLANMKKRSSLLGIHFSIHSIPNQGTEVKLFIPANQLNISTDGV